ncbi:MAG: pyrroline-5-carboxylate reductase [Flavobacteriia bacterium]|nr:pyrroline-5-carboxylate reductase [Flavobacteriia bacterium]OIP48786.1 MAG: pyrroline-5-carboxylate reductase [Flavobacteriaceae bacterium CG2_30_31_66]PIV95505.1 MAG: pyrroline-5-carboxylate reductase [Flavobacteriaceae bacterium CG17_big_fil_post_rev_8_21_14_2_50_31_13]PIX11208.1 MAG: pyrroline-5-carboxylate reductase [Flavobacteriaceae bacterium CG_4_8_14_3_um_filter_31_8]PIY14214.1 MAG: pyrroline-5-carboxylate reductase [Flavobacteriaceae bacterium CG_4_10_14_3_um_filter_31_253]PIZ10323
MKIAIIGTGNLGKSIAKGLIIDNAITTLYLSRRNLGSISEFDGYKNVFLTTDNKEVVQNSDILILAVQPAHLEKILQEITPFLTNKHVLISTVTGFGISKIEETVGKETFIIRAMPNTAIAVGKSMTCLCSNEQGKNRIKIAEAIFNRLGHSLTIPENQMQAATVVCASGVAFWMRLIRATTQAAIQLGFDAKEAQELAMFTCEGAANLLIVNGNHPEEEIDKVTTPKGCTIEGLNEMEHKGLSSSLIHGMVASFNKINNIKKEQI